MTIVIKKCIGCMREVTVFQELPREPLYCTPECEAEQTIFSKEQLEQLEKEGTAING